MYYLESDIGGSSGKVALAGISSGKKKCIRSNAMQR